MLKRLITICALAALTACNGDFSSEGLDAGSDANINNVNNSSDMGDDACSDCVPVVVCGDGEVGGAENCDGTDVQDQTCESLGFASGVLACDTAACRFDTAACQGAGPTCGDNFAVGDEVCDGSDLSNATCIGEGFDGGTLACNTTCDAVDTTGCTTCGDTVISTGEDCEGTDLQGQTCQDMGFDGGTLGCSDVCGYDISQCTRITCPNGQLDDGEDCEPGVAFQATCGDLTGFDGGTLTCAGNCAWDTSACTECGDGAVEGNEVCDTTTVPSTCETLPNSTFTGGNLACNATCDGYVTTGCTECGNGTREGTEQCDTTDLAGSDCMSIGFGGGTLGCKTDCSYDTQACYACNDGNLDPGEACDGTDLNGNTCASVDATKPAGTLQCSAQCTLDNTMCGIANDTDNDGVIDAADPAPNNFKICGDSDNDSCDDCSVEGTQNVANDGFDPDGDGACELPLDYDCMNGANAATDAYRLESCVMFTHVNNDRAHFTAEAGNAPAVTWNEDIWAVAKAHAVDMCTSGLFAHTNAAGLSPQDRAAAAGLGFGIAENISVNLDAGAAQYGFMEEPTCTGHRGAILSPKNTELGVGYHICSPAQAPANYMWDGHHHIVQNYRYVFSNPDSAFCQAAATDCEIPPNPPTTATCPQQLIGFGFCPVPSAATLTGWGCPND